MRARRPTGMTARRCGYVRPREAGPNRRQSIAPSAAPCWGLERCWSARRLASAAGPIEPTSADHASSRFSRPPLGNSAGSSHLMSATCAPERRRTAGQARPNETPSLTATSLRYDEPPGGGPGCRHLFSQVQCRPFPTPKLGAPAAAGASGLTSRKSVTNYPFGEPVRLRPYLTSGPRPRTPCRLHPAIPYVSTVYYLITFQVMPGLHSKNSR